MRLALLVHEPLMGCALALVALAAPIGCAAWLRRQALLAPSRDVAPAWFGYARRAQWLVIGTWLLWLVALSISGADQNLPRVLRPERDGWTSVVRWMLTVIPPALASLGIQALTHDVQRRLRGSETTLSEHLRSSLLQLAALIVPFSLLLLTPIAFLTHHAALGALSAVGVVLSRMWLLRLHADALGLEPLSVTTGPLRDCLFDLARRARVPIRQLYVLPTTRGRLANAFAMNGGSVILTDYLLEHLSEREVAATLAHEIGHLRAGHPRKLALTLVASAVVSAAILPSLAENVGLSRVLAIVLSVLLSGFVTMLVARRFERTADAAAIELTRDPESLITALVRLSRVNHVPLDWGAWAERGLTHPSTVRRAHAIGRRAGLPAARVEELLHHTPPVDQRFALDVPKLGDRFFTALWKARVNANGVVVLLALYGLVPAAVVAMLRSDMPLPGTRLAAIVLAALAGIAVTLGATDALAVRPYAALRRRITEQRRRRGLDADRCGGWFVGLSPSAEPRLYDFHGDWDVGHLFPMRQRLCYVGEATRFELSRADIVSIDPVPGLPNWISAPRVLVTWRDAATDRGGVVSFRPADVSSLASIRARSRALLERLRGWHRNVVTPNADPVIEPLGLPRDGEVTSLDPAALHTPAAILRTFVLSGLAAAVAAAVLGLSFDTRMQGFLDALLATWAVAAFHRAPWWIRARPRKTRAAEPALGRAA
ncbi:MAG TPA: M48 family metalloprotease [Candidatus Udaeobacter sp.]|nr:M48 family metalloprotease [Candidatus Udaeobacter sp.]